MSYDEFTAKLVSENAALRSELADKIIAKAVAESIAYTVAHPAPSPCGHSSQYAYTEDGGKHIRCLICTDARLRTELAEKERQMKAVWDYLKPNPSNDMHWCDEIIIAIDSLVDSKLALYRKAVEPVKEWDRRLARGFESEEEMADCAVVAANSCIRILGEAGNERD